MSITSYATLVANARTLAKLTQRELAQLAQTAQPLVARIESGRANPTIETVDRLLDAAGFQLRMELVPKETPDPVVEAYKRDVDRTLLRENLKRTLDERMRIQISMSEFVDEIRRATLKAKRKK